jgi:hypothetical protein
VKVPGTGQATSPPSLTGSQSALSDRLTSTTARAVLADNTAAERWLAECSVYRQQLRTQRGDSTHRSLRIWSPHGERGLLGLVHHERNAVDRTRDAHVEATG